MPELDFRITGCEPVVRGPTPLLKFQANITNRSAAEPIHSVLLHARIQIQSFLRSYSVRETSKLEQLAGLPVRRGWTPGNFHWTTSSATLGTFVGGTTALFPVPCTYDSNPLVAEYCEALEEGSVPLLFLFSGTVFHTTRGGSLQAQQIPWNKQATFRMPVRVWRELTDRCLAGHSQSHFHRDSSDKLCA